MGSECPVYTFNSNRSRGADYLINRPSEGVHVPVDSLTLDREQGIIGDRWATTAWIKLTNGSTDPKGSSEHDQ